MYIIESDMYLNGGRRINENTWEFTSRAHYNDVYRLTRALTNANMFLNHYKDQAEKLRKENNTKTRTNLVYGDTKPGQYVGD